MTEEAQDWRDMTPTTGAAVLAGMLQRAPGELGDLREAGALLSLDALLERYLPRGKGAVPRWLGRVSIEDELRVVNHPARHQAGVVAGQSGYLRGNAVDE